MFKQLTVPLSSAGFSKAVSTFWILLQPCCTFAVPDMQPEPPSSWREGMVLAEAVPLSTEAAPPPTEQLCI